jgi:hypothetical protein
MVITCSRAEIKAIDSEMALMDLHLKKPPEILIFERKKVFMQSIDGVLQASDRELMSYALARYLYCINSTWKVFTCTTMNSINANQLLPPPIMQFHLVPCNPHFIHPKLPFRFRGPDIFGYNLAKW